MKSSTLNSTRQSLSNDDIRKILLQYLYDRNKNARSRRGKKGAAVKISEIRKALRESHRLTVQQVQSNLSYLISSGWVETEVVKKSIPGPKGGLISQETIYYKISAKGIDKIEGSGEFTESKFQGIKIEATGQNIITLGDGNQINAQFSELGSSLAELRKAITQSSVDEASKLALVADIDTIQSQLIKPTPTKRIIEAAWQSIQAAASIEGLAGLIERAEKFIRPLFT